MDREALLDALRHTSFDRHRCFGCGYEHNCSIHGCAVNLAAAELIEEQAARIAELELPPNDPLTLEELQGMDGEPVWVEGDRETEIGCNGWAILYFSEGDLYARVFFPLEEYADIPSLASYGETWLAYRRKPEESVK